MKMRTKNGIMKREENRMRKCGKEQGRDHQKGRKQIGAGADENKERSHPKQRKIKQCKCRRKYEQGYQRVKKM